MKRFIRYLYEYESGKRIRNVGFVKVETGDEETIVHMQAKGFQNSEDRKLELYFFYVENENVVRIRQAELNLTSPALSEHLRCMKSDFEKSDGAIIYDRICGILVETGTGRRMAATWDDMPVDVSRVKDYEPVDRVEADSVRESEQSIETCCGEEKAELDVQKEKDLCSGRKKITKIQHKDISKLPRCEWKLANNQFLVHGYNNFHHLLLIEQGNHLKLGVPGIYHIEEEKCADMFGFGEFISAEELEIGSMSEQESVLEQDNMETGEWFGYWCRPVRGKFR